MTKGQPQPQKLECVLKHIIGQLYENRIIPRHIFMQVLKIQDHIKLRKNKEPKKKKKVNTGVPSSLERTLNIFSFLCY